MYFEQFYLGCLAHASYLLASQGEAVVVDPQRDVDLYLTAAAQHDVTIRHIIETHLHADFVSGHKELAARTGAKIYIGAQAGATFPHIPVRDGFELKFGKAAIRVLETPGHTPESICLVVTDKEKSSKPWAVLTGDTLFIGDVGRPDLSPRHTPAELAGLLYDSLHGKLLKLGDDVLVYPAHGAGSLCGKNMRAERSSTIGMERLTNYALQIHSKEEFVKQLTSHLPARPEYFLKDAEINRTGAAPLSDLPPLRAIEPPELKIMLQEGEIALDVRPGEEFAPGHVPGSVNIALAGQFASWAGTVLGLTAHPVLIAASDAQLEEARLRLARVGIEALDGYLAGGIAAWKQAGFELAAIPQISAVELDRRMKAREVQVLDVRREPEWESAHIAQATWWPLDNFRVAPPELDRDAAIAVHCKGGYRSMIAASLLQRAGFTHVINVSGGFDAWQGANLPVVIAKPVSA
ncbi:MAG TPA: rhodanese-like domain-containing protein [Candidatus Sulfotelmatobacter sp.]|jgi:glyoxylase-like metal-dependent hydrolase (beta-lactamase superfamily II)|nr:rhodanese-like domain-containing protein [Candidatus Sulfotelmatobacter sp.]